MSVTKVQLVSDGAIIGIQSAGSPVGTGATILNFIGTGNTFAYNAGTKTLNVSISSGGTNIFTILSRSGAGVTVSAPASTLTVYGRNSNTSISI